MWLSPSDSDPVQCSQSGWDGGVVPGSDSSAERSHLRGPGSDVSHRQLSQRGFPHIRFSSTGVIIMFIMIHTYYNSYSRQGRLCYNFSSFSQQVGSCQQRQWCIIILVLNSHKHWNILKIPCKCRLQLILELTFYQKKFNFFCSSWWLNL